MFSARFAPDTSEPSPLWEALLERRSAGVEVIDLTRSNPTMAGFDYPEALPALLAQASILKYEPDARGLPAARQAVCDYLNARARSRGEKPDFDPGAILLTASTSEAYGFLFKLLCDPGDEVLIPTPTYPLFDALADLEHIRLVRYPLRLSRGEGSQAPHRWRADLGFLQRMVSTRTKALILVSPNNPTGHIADPGEIAAYLDLARDHGLALIVDEVFSEYLLGPIPCRSVISDGPLVFTLNGLSKLAALPQLKLGWVHVGGDPALVEAALGHLEWIADAYLSVNTPVQAACSGILGLAPALRSPIQARLKANLRSALDLAGARPGSRLRALAPDAGWSLVLEIASASDNKDMDDQSVALDLLRTHGVYVHPGHLFGFEETADRLHLVLSLLTPENDFREGLRRIVQHLENPDPQLRIGTP